MANENISKVYLLSVPLENDYKHTLYFTDKSSQNSYFMSKKIKEYTNFTYQRKDNLIYVPAHYDDIYNCNYVMYQNTKYNNKWFYAFVKNLKYENDECTILEIETDVIQTWLFDYTIKPSFVEKEHVSDDSIGLHTFPENLESGEYVVNSVFVDPTLDNVFSDTSYVIGASVNINSSEEKCPHVGGGKYNGIYSGVKYYSYTRGAEAGITAKLKDIAEKGQADTITGVFIVPSILASNNNTSGGEVTSTDHPVSYNISVLKDYGLNGYTPRNKKLYTHPYCYLIGSNGCGNDNIYHYEQFSDEHCTFNVKAVLCPGASIRLTPTNYKGATENDMEGINLGKYPICNYSVDMYTNWLTQNSVNVGGVNFTSDTINTAQAGSNTILGTIGSFLTGNIVGGVNNLINGGANIASALIQQKQHELIPPAVKGNLNSGDVMTASSKNNFRFYKMSIKKEYAQIIDKYFDMYGYTVNLVKTPNKAHRSRYWYTKTIDINIDGSIPQDDMQKIKNAYNQGITFWRNASEIQNYELSNEIV